MFKRIKKAEDDPTLEQAQKFVKGLPTITHNIFHSTHFCQLILLKN